MRRFWDDSTVRDKPNILVQTWLEIPRLARRDRGPASEQAEPTDLDA
jgi:hypothetical protein